MHKSFIAFLVLGVATTAWAYSSGAPTGVCDDMTPKHPYDPQKSDLPFSVSISKTALKPGEQTEITISGKEFKGFLVQVRNGDKAVGSFDIAPTDKEAKSIKCHNTDKSAATHSNSSTKKSVTLKWKAPKQKGDLQVYVTVAADGAVFWAKKAAGKIKVN